jgi:hypothetical protein
MKAKSKLKLIMKHQEEVVKGEGEGMATLVGTTNDRKLRFEVFPFSLQNRNILAASACRLTLLSVGFSNLALF